MLVTDYEADVAALEADPARSRADVLAKVEEVRAVGCGRRAESTMAEQDDLIARLQAIGG